MSDKPIAELEAEAKALVSEIGPLLHGRLPELQGYVLAELTAIWIGGHVVLGSARKTKEYQADTLRLHRQLVAQLIRFYRDNHPATRVAKMRTTRLKKLAPCPFCQAELDAATSADPAHPDDTPSPGNVTVCISCAQILVFTDDMQLRAPARGEVEMTEALQQAQEAVRSIDRRNMRSR